MELARLEELDTAGNLILDRWSLRLLAVHAAVDNAFRVARHRLKAMQCRLCREQAFHALDLDYER